MSDPKILVDMDEFHSDKTALDFTSEIDPNEVGLKVGLSLFMTCGTKIITTLVKRGFQVFLDLKFNDVPETITRSVHIAATLGVWMVSVSAFSSIKGLRSARSCLDSLNSHGARTPLLITEIRLPGLDSQEWHEVGLLRHPENQIQNLAKLAKKSQSDGILCNAGDLAIINKIPDFGNELVFIIPIHGNSFKRLSQGSCTTRSQSSHIRNKDNCIILMGKEITHANNPMQAIKKILS